MEKTHPSTPEIVAMLLHSLNHAIRTPLSVVSNELHYLSEQVPKGECERAIKRCQEISSILKNIAQIGERDSSVVEVEISKLTATETGFKSPKLFLDEHRLKEFLFIVAIMLKRLTAITSVPDQMTIEFSPVAKNISDSNNHDRVHDRSGLVLEWKLPISFKQGAICESLAGFNGSCSVFFIEKCKIDLPEAAIVDILAKHLQFSLALLENQGRIAFKAIHLGPEGSV